MPAALTLEEKAQRKQARQQQRQESYKDPVLETPRGFNFLGYFGVTRQPEFLEQDGIGTGHLKSMTGVEIPMGECKSCGAVVRWQSKQKDTHMSNCGGKRKRGGW